MVPVQDMKWGDVQVAAVLNMDEEIATHRLNLLTAIIKQHIGIVPAEKKSATKEPSPAYFTPVEQDDVTLEYQ